jgi:DDHD domain
MAEKIERKEPSHLVFVLHGIGYNHGDDGKDSALAKNLKDLRQNCAESLKTEFSDVHTKLEWIPISWHKQLHSLSTVERIKSVTLPTCSLMRNVANDILSDVMYYFTAFHGQQILNVCCEMLNEEYANFMARNPSFNGTVSIFAHSLGSIIAYDLLANQNGIPKTPPRYPVKESHGTITYPKLNFTPSFLFMVGSPLGAVLIQRGQELKEYNLPSTKCFNLFNLYDPLAYRLEPLLDQRYADISPVLVQRPTRRRTEQYEFNYYKEMVYAYLPDLSGLQLPTMAELSTSMNIPSFSSSFGNIPSISTSFGTIPKISSTLPTISTNLPSLSTSLSSLPSIPTFERLFPFLSSGLPLDLNLPSNSILESAQNLLQSQISKLWPNPVLGDKRKSNNDDDGDIKHADKKRAIEHIDNPAKRIRSSTRTKPKHPSPKRKPKHSLTTQITNIFPTRDDDSSSTLKSNLLNLSSELTSRLVTAASAAKEDMSSVPVERMDYFVQDRAVSVARQYFLGLSAHFGYWSDGDIMYLILKNLKDSLGC